MNTLRSVNVQRGKRGEHWVLRLVRLWWGALYILLHVLNERWIKPTIVTPYQ